MEKIFSAITLAVIGSFFFGSSQLALADDDFSQSSQKTFYRDVLPILQENCQVCHRPDGSNMGGMVAPMALTTYKETRPWAKSISQTVSTKYMPPWNAAPEFHGVFKGERTITQDQIDTMVAWAKTGAVAGNPADGPEPLLWADNDGWSIGEPDLVLSMPEPYFVEDDVKDLYKDFVLEITPEMLPEDRWVKAVEFRPGGPVVHHIIAIPLGGIAPGNGPSVYADGLGARFKTNSRLIWQMHYHKEPGPGTGAWDQSQVAIKFYPKGTEIEYPIDVESMGRFDFVIPPGDSNYSISKEHVFDYDAQIVSFMPHMHLRGKAAKYVATYPDGTEETLLDVPAYDFNWQTAYRFKEFKQAPKGTKVTFTATWDNSAENEANPNPNREVKWGRPTHDEMGFGWMASIHAEAGQEAHRWGGGG